MPVSSYAVAAYSDFRKFLAFAERVFESRMVVAHEYERGFFEIVQIHVGVDLSDFRIGYGYAEPVCVPFAPIAVAAYVDKSYARVAVVSLGELFNELGVLFYEYGIVKMRSDPHEGRHWF